MGHAFGFGNIVPATYKGHVCDLEREKCKWKLRSVRPVQHGSLAHTTLPFEVGVMGSQLSVRLMLWACKEKNGIESDIG